MCVPVTQTPPLGPVQVVANRVRQYRQWRGWSARELAERCQQAGLEKWNREIIANLERGKRGIVSIDEVLVLAYVLGVPPITLFVPVGDEQEFQVTPNLVTQPLLAMRWIFGELPRPEGMAVLPGSIPSEPGQIQVWHRARIPIDLYERFDQAASALRDAETAVAMAERRLTETGTGDAEREALTQARAAVDASLRQIAGALNTMIEAGVVSPVVSPELLGRLSELRLLDHPEQVVPGTSSGVQADG